MACGTSTPEMSQAARAATSARQYELVGRGAVQNRLGKRSGLGSPWTTAAGLSGRPQSGQCGDRTNTLEGGGGTQQRSHSGPLRTYPGLPWGAAGRGLAGSQNQNRSPEGVSRGGDMRSWCESAKEPRRCTSSATPVSHWSRHDATGRHRVGGKAWRGHHTLGWRYSRASARSRVSAWGRRGAGERRVRPPREEQCGHAGVGPGGAREYRAPQSQQANHAAWVPGGSTPSSGKVERKRKTWWRWWVITSRRELDVANETATRMRGSKGRTVRGRMRGR